MKNADKMQAAIVKLPTIKAKYQGYFGEGDKAAVLKKLDALATKVGGEASYTDPDYAGGSRFMAWVEFDATPEAIKLMEKCARELKPWTFESVQNQYGVMEQIKVLCDDGLWYEGRDCPARIDIEHPLVWAESAPFEYSSSNDESAVNCVGITRQGTYIRFMAAFRNER